MRLVMGKINKYNLLILYNEIRQDLQGLNSAVMLKKPFQVQNRPMDFSKS